jgi:ABC-type lipoprotein release transport system permease subunit
MLPVLLRLRAEVRSNLRGWLAVSLLVGLLGGLVIAAAAGARRTETAVGRLAEASKISDISMPVGSEIGYADLSLDRVKQLPQVASAYHDEGFFYRGLTDKGRKFDTSEVGLSASPDGGGVTQDRPNIVAGRAADPDRVDEVVPEESAARAIGLKVGSTFSARFASKAQGREVLAAQGGSGEFKLRGPRVRFRVVGLSASYSAFANESGDAKLTAGFARAYGPRLAQLEAFWIRLRDPKRDLPTFEAAARRLAGGDRLDFFSISSVHQELQRGIHLQAAALWLLAALGAAAALLVLGQAIARQAFVGADEYPTLRALGMTHRQLFSLTMWRAGAMAVVGAVVAAALAVGLSPLAPIGADARKAEPHPGLSVDVLIVAGGAGATVLLVLAVTAIPAWRAARVGADVSGPGAPAGERRAGLADRAARAGFPPTAVAGVRMALERGRGRTAVPVGATICGVLLAVATIVTAISFGASVDHLLSTPRLYGLNWDAEVGDSLGPDLSRRGIPALERDRDIAAFSAGTFQEASIDGTLTPMMAMDHVRGSIGPSAIDGRLPTAPDELLLATKTMARVGADVGDVVTIRVRGRSARFRVVGKGVIPDNEGAGLRLGRGAMVTFGGLKKLVPTAPHNVFLLRVRTGIDKQAALDRLRELGALGGRKPVDIANFNRIDSMPFAIGGLLGVIAVAVMAHTLLTSVRRRRRDLAVLKTLGFERGQISRVVAWQATTIALLAVAIGIPLGIAGGRWAWTIFADEIGIVPQPVIPFLPILLVVPAAILVANLIAAVPATLAARTPAALALRAE